MLHYTTYDHPESREWVTFIHGAGGSSSIWFRQLRAFTHKYNVLLIDLRGHGRSKNFFSQKLKRYSFEVITNDVLEVLDHLKIAQSHFVGISLGTVIIRELADRQPVRVKSMIMGGAIMKLNFQSQLLMRLGVWFKSVIPYILLYRFFAFMIMPRKAHRESRNLFIQEAKKLYQNEFIRWFRLASEINPLLRFFREQEVSIPTLYIMGAEDHMFLPAIRKLIQHHEMSALEVIPNCGHVVNVDQPGIFNSRSIAFIEDLG